jgi:lipoate-protein ligase A
MAVDHALLEKVSELGAPVLRFYGWTEPAASFGYFQKIADVERLTPLRPLIRRPSGGGIVPHDADWTYSLAFPADHEWHGLRATESYRRVHVWLQSAFAFRGLQTTLAPFALKSGPGQCFAGYEQHDLLWRGAKVAGAAQRRTRTGLLIQGSVQPGTLGPDVAGSRHAWEQAMCESQTRASGVIWRDLTDDSDLVFRRAADLAINRYSRDSYNRGR